MCDFFPPTIASFPFYLCIRLSPPSEEYILQCQEWKLSPPFEHLDSCLSLFSVTVAVCLRLDREERFIFSNKEMLDNVIPW